MRGNCFIREASPLFASPCLGLIILGSLRGALAPLNKIFPFPLIRGKGIQGIGLINYLRTKLGDV